MFFNLRIRSEEKTLDGRDGSEAKFLSGGAAVVSKQLKRSEKKMEIFFPDDFTTMFVSVPRSKDQGEVVEVRKEFDRGE